MAWLQRLTNVFRQQRLNQQLDDELSAHLEEAAERGRSPRDVRLAFGSALQHREHSRDVKLLPWLTALTSDVVFGWRQIKKHRTASAAAVLSVALAVGATTAAFHLVHAVLLRTLPIAEPGRLFYLATVFIDHDGNPGDRDDFDYPTFRRYREAAAGRADLLLVGHALPRDAAIGSGAATEKIREQFFSGNVFPVFGLRPALGRLLAPDDDRAPGSNAVAVISYDYWTRRFSRDPNAIGQTLRIKNDRLEIVGVAPQGFTGTEPGVITDIFVPSMMNVDALDSPGWSWLRIWVRPKPEFSVEQLRQPLQAALNQDRDEIIRNLPADTPRNIMDSYLGLKILFYPAAAGASNLQKEYRRPLLILGALVALVLLLACANVGNLLTAQAASRAREMALRVSIGAGRGRLVQLVLVESSLLAIASSIIGTFFAWWSAPLVVEMLHVPQDPVRLVLSTGWFELGFSLLLAFAVTLFFGLVPALRASSVKPMSALKGGEDPHARRRVMNVMLAAQMAFCVLVLFIAGLFVASFQRLSNRPLGFSTEHILVMDAQTETPQPSVWMQVADSLRQTPGVQVSSLAGWALLSGNGMRGGVRVPGDQRQPPSVHFLEVSPAFFDTMRIALIGGRDFRPNDVPPRFAGQGQPLPGVGIVNEEFARVFFHGRSPVGRSVDVRFGKDLSPTMEIVGYVRDASYSNVREPMRPTVYIPLGAKSNLAFIVRTAGDPLLLAPLLRHRVSQLRSDIVVDTVNSQAAFVRWQLIRERLLSTLALFFALVALVLAAVGLYGVLNYSVARQRREIGIRMALGARSVHVIGRVTAGMLLMVALGSAAGLAAGLASSRFVEALLFEVKPTDLPMLIAPIAILFGAALLAALPPAIWAVRIDPAQTLRAE